MIRLLALLTAILFFSISIEAQHSTVERAFSNPLPAEINLAHTWNRSLVKSVGKCMGYGHNKFDGDQQIAVSLSVIGGNGQKDVTRLLSQSPYLTAELGIELVKGLQLNPDLDAAILIEPKDINVGYTAPYKRVLVEAKTRGEVHIYNNGRFARPSMYNVKMRAEEMAQGTLQAARESMVLLKNEDGTLPMDGQAAKEVVVGYGGEAGKRLCEELRKMYGDSIEVSQSRDLVSEVADTLSALYRAKTVIMVQGDEPIRRELELLKGMDKRIVLVLVNTRAISLEWEKENVAAMIEAWQPGRAGIEALAAILSGKYNPGGKLTLDFPDYPIGHGLGYAAIDYSNLTITETEKDGEKEWKVEFDLTNGADIDACEVAQVYISKPLEDGTRTLEACKRTNLKGKEVKHMGFTIRRRNMQKFEFGQSVVPNGVYNIYVGASSSDIRLEGSFELR